MKLIASPISPGTIITLVSLMLVSGCYAPDVPRRPPRPVAERDARAYVLEVTGYCHCGPCCGWKRNWRGQPVYAYGPHKGQRKDVGITASGTRVRPGTIAADTDIFPFGTVMYVPGYGYGVVEDRGGAIKGHKIDLYFRSHQRALEWGRQRKQVNVWLP